MSDTKLLPCPWCGGSPKRVFKHLSEVYAYADSVRYECRDCLSSRGAVGDTSKPGYADNSTVEERAIVAWNTRTPPEGYVKITDLQKAINHGADLIDVTCRGRQKDEYTKAGGRIIIESIQATLSAAEVKPVKPELVTVILPEGTDKFKGSS